MAQTTISLNGTEYAIDTFAYQTLVEYIKEIENKLAPTTDKSAAISDLESRIACLVDQHLSYSHLDQVSLSIVNDAIKKLGDQVQLCEELDRSHQKTVEILIQEAEARKQAETADGEPKEEPQVESARPAPKEKKNKGWLITLIVIIAIILGVPAGGGIAIVLSILFSVLEIFHTIGGFTESVVGDSATLIASAALVCILPIAALITWLVARKKQKKTNKYVWIGFLVAWIIFLLLGGLKAFNITDKFNPNFFHFDLQQMMDSNEDDSMYNDEATWDTSEEGLTEEDITVGEATDDLFIDESAQ